MRKHLAFTSILAVIVLLIAAGCGPTGTPASPQSAGDNPPSTEEPTAEATESSSDTPAETPETMTVSSGIQLDPALAADLGSSAEDALLVDGYIYEGLTALDGSDPVPALAVDWTVSDDGLDYLFDLRSGVTFQDGTPFDADAVVANFNRWFSPASALRGDGSYQAWADAFAGFEGEVDSEGQPVSSVDGIEKVDNLTVLVHLNRPNPDLPAKLAQGDFAMVSPTALAANMGSYGTSAAADAIAGTGPYTVASWTDSSLVLDPYPDYWGTPPDASLEFTLE